MAQRRVILRRTTALLVTVGLAMAACDDGGSTTPTTSGPGTTQPGGGGTGTGAAPRLFGLQLSEGEALAAAADPTAVVPGEGLDQAALDAIIARLPAWLGGGAQEEPFNWPTQSSPPPRTGATVDVPFPPADTTPPETVPTGPLQVLRFQPEGEAPIAPYVAITFNQPMVPVGTVAQVSASDVPAAISPAIAGQWQWIGTRTLRFDATNDLADRLPMATTFTVTVPAGTTSATGGELAADVSFRFTTPPPSVQSFSPGDGSESLARDQLFIATFDQRIDPAAVLATVHMRAGGQQAAVRLATAAEVAADDSARNISENAEEGRWLAFRPVELLPTDTALTVDIGPGTPSAEGPGTTDTATTFRGHTYRPLTVTANCPSEGCAPGSDLYLTFSNPLDGSLSTAVPTVTPALAGMSTGVMYDSLVISGATLARTAYTITVPGSFTDVFGQTLGSDQTVTVRIGSAQPSLAQYEAITTLDPFATGQTLSMLTVNHDQLRVRVFAADPAEFAEYLKYSYERDYDDTPLPAWGVLSDQTITVAGADDAMVDTPIDLSGVLQGKPGQVIVLVEPVPAPDPSSNDYWQNRPALTWVQSTHLGVDALADNMDARVWATDLRTGAPVDGVALQILPGASANTATTDADGLATIALTDGPSFDVGSYIVATKGDETALLPLGVYRSPADDGARWFVFDDRQVYRPGETMRAKGWVRRVAFSDDGTLRQLNDGDTVTYTVSDSYGNEIAMGEAAIGSLGGFDLQVDVPPTANLGQATLQMTLVGEPGFPNNEMSNWHSFQIQEYRTPEFEVTTRPESEGPYLSTQPATVAAAGTYYAGGPLAQSAVDWLVTTSTATYSPPGWDDFTFGIWQPWWYGDFSTDGYSPSSASDVCCGPVGQTTTKEYHGTTDGAGTHYLRIVFEGQDGTLPDLPVTVNAQATINDVNRQAWSSSTGLLVHAADRYVGLRSTRTFVRQGDPLDIEVVVAGIDGEALSGVTLNVVAGRLEWKFVDGEWTETVADEQTCDVTSATEQATCTFDTSIGGQYKVSAVVAGTDGGKNRTELTTWVSGATSQPSRGVQQQELTVVPDQATYAAGDTAELLVQAPFATGEGVLTVAHNGMRDTVRFQVAGGSAVLQVPIAEADVPQLSLHLEVVGAMPRTADDGTALPDAPLQPAYATGTITLSVPPVARTLAVTATPRATELTPGESTTIDVTVHDAAGQPVQGAEFAVVVVDEAVLALSGYDLPDPLGVFYAGGYEYLTDLYSRAQIRLLDPTRLDGSKGEEGATETTAAASDEYLPSAAPGADTDTSGGGNASSGVNPVDVRSNFDALALFEPSVVTGADGAAAVELTLPDNLTRYRVMVVAVSGADRFGSAESNITARLPLAVRPSAPRFANFGDAFELPVVLQNQSDAPLTVQVVLETANLAQAGAATSEGAAGEGATGRTVTVPANDRVEVRFPVTTMQAGTAAFRVTAVSGDLADSATVQLPVYTPTTTEAFATYGVIDLDVGDGGAIDQPLLAPTDVVPGFGGLEITTSSTSLQALTDAVLYISQYPYDNSDGRASRIIAIASLADVLDAFDAEGLPTRAEIDTSMKADVAALAAMQNDDGGFPSWQRYRRSEPFNTVQVTHALLLARERGYTVPQNTLDRALQHLADIEQHIPPEYGQQQIDMISAYALSVRDSAGQGDAAKARRLYQDRGDQLTVDALAWLWSAVDDAAIGAEIERTLNNRAVETAGAANFVVDYGDSDYLTMHSDRRTDGIVLDALIANAPDSDLIPKVVTGLLANQVKGRWDNVQENGFILLALRHYFDEFEAQTPSFVASVWLGQQFAGEHTFQGRETDRARISIPTSELIAAGDTDLVLAKDGTGRMYYRIGLRYAPVDLQLDALDRGFVVQRTYEAIDDPADVSRDADGTWHVKAGARVRITLTMVAESQRTHVALIDPLPAGFESLNPELAVTQTTPEPVTDDGAAPYDDWSWWGRWYEHEQLRTDRTEAFTTFLSAGTYTYSYVARATTPGTFVVPPTRAEEMYAPETFGRAATDKVIVE